MNKGITHFKKGQIPWNKGLKYNSPKIAVANKGKHYSVKTEINNGTFKERLVL
jgi:hypothetical protein